MAEGFEKVENFVSGHILGKIAHEEEPVVIHTSSHYGWPAPDRMDRHCLIGLGMPSNLEIVLRHRSLKFDSVI